MSASVRADDAGGRAALDRGGDGPAAQRADHVEGFEPPSIAAGGVDALVFRGIELVAKVLLVAVTGRLMAPAGRGLYALASLCTGLCSLPFGSIWVANSVELARRRATLRELLGTSIVIATAGGILTALVAFAIAPLLGDRWWVIALPAAITPFMLLLRYQEGLYTAFGHIRAVNLIRVGRAVLPLVFITPPLLAGASPRTAIGIWTLTFVALPAMVWFPLVRLIGGPQFIRDRALYERILKYGLKISGLGVVPMLNERVALIALAVFTSDADVGVFSIAIAATEVVILATQALALSTYRRIGNDDAESSAALTARTVRHSVVLAAAGGILLVPAVAVGVPVVLGAGYEDVALLYVLLIPNVIAYAGVSPLHTFFSVQAAKPVTLLWATGSALVTNVGLTLVLTPLFGTWGAAIAASIAGLMALAVAIWCFIGESGTPLRALRPGRQELADYVTLAEGLLRRWRART
jgi:O-antigen/teichoic acid export membrane protein